MCRDYSASISSSKSSSSKINALAFVQPESLTVSTCKRAFHGIFAAAASSRTAIRSAITANDLQQLSWSRRKICENRRVAWLGEFPTSHFLLHCAFKTFPLANLQIHSATLIFCSSFCGWETPCLNLVETFWAAAPKGRCPVGHRGEFPDVRTSVRTYVRTFPPPPEASQASNSHWITRKIDKMQTSHWILSERCTSLFMNEKDEKKFLNIFVKSFIKILDQPQFCISNGLWARALQRRALFC